MIIYFLLAVIAFLIFSLVLVWKDKKHERAIGEQFARKYHKTWAALDQCARIAEHLRRQQIHPQEAGQLIIKIRSEALE